MEQLGPSATTNTADIPTAVPRTPNSTSPPIPTNTSNSVPSLRFPRPLGNRQLTNWVSSSSPDIMSAGDFQYEGPLDDSIADLGYEFIGTDGESQPGSTTSSYDHQIPELSDDVQSLADTDAGTDVETQDVDDTDSSEDEEEPTMLHQVVPRAAVDNEPAEHEMDEDDIADMETMANRSLEHPTELFTPDSARISQLVSALDNPLCDQAGAAELSARLEGLIKSDERLKTKTVDASAESPSWTSALNSTHTAAWLRRPFYNQDGTLKDRNTRLIIGVLGLLMLSAIQSCLSHFLWKMSPLSQHGGISTVPVASVSSIAVSTTTENLMTPATISSTPAAATPFNSLQSTSSANSLIYNPELYSKQNICSVELYGRNEILLKIPQKYRSTWLNKQSVMISVSRGLKDISSEHTKVSSVDEGFLIEIPQNEAYGVLDVSVATTRKPKINETFQVIFGRYIITDAFDAGKQLMKGFAQTVVDTVNGTTAWVEGTCMPAFDSVSKQVTDQTASVSDSVMQGFRDASKAVLGMPSRLTTQVAGQVKQSFNKDLVQQRLFQAEAELLRQAHEARDEMALSLLKAQITSKLWWLKVQGKLEEHDRYLAAAGPYSNQKRAEALDARRERAERTKKNIRAQRKQQRRDARRSFWGVAGEGGF